MSAVASGSPRPFGASERTDGQRAAADGYASFVAYAQRRLLRAFAARFGVDAADDLVAEVFEHAWSRWADVATMDNPVGYLFTVGCSKSRRYTRWGRRPTFPVEPVRPVESQLDLFDALRELTDDQRVAVLAIHGFGWTYAEVAELLDVRVSAVNNFVHRGMARLRQSLDVGEGDL